MSANLALREDAALHLDYFRVKNVSNVSVTNIKIAAFNRATELSPKEELCCNSATD